MFPTLRVKITGLDPLKHYWVILDMMPVTDCRYKFCDGRWMAASKTDVYAPPRRFIHPNSPAIGSYWMDETVVSFHRVKLTNSVRDCSDNVSCCVIQLSTNHLILTKSPKTVTKPSSIT